MRARWKTRRLATAGCLALGLLHTAAFGQDPGAAATLGGLEPARPIDAAREPIALEEPSPGPAFVLPPLPKAPAAAPLSAGPRFRLTGVDFEGGTVFSPDELAALAAPLIGREIAIEQLEELRRRVTLLYVEAGYLNSGAVLPDQQISDGRVAYRLIEGRLSEIRVVGAVRVSEAYVRDQLAREAGPPLNVRRLERRLRILLDDPLIERVDARLSPGAAPGEGVLTAEVEDPPPVSVHASIDNGRAPSVGAVEGRVAARFRNVSGLGDLGELAFGETDGLRDLEGRLSLPVFRWGTRAGFRFQLTDAEIVEEPFNAVDVESEARTFEVSLRQPLHRAPGEELAAELFLARRASETFLLGEPFSFSTGVEDGRSVVTVARAALGWLDRGPDQVLALRAIFSAGLGAFGATENIGETPDGQFLHWIGQAQWVRRFDLAGLEGVRLVARGEAQLTEDQLLPLEKFAVGGADSIRGYRENALVRDNGWNAGLELRVPVATLPIPGLDAELQDGRVDVAPFVDVGQSWSVGVDDPDPKTLASIGVGLRWAPIRNVAATLYWGSPINDLPTPADRNLQDSGLHFAVRAKVFEF